MIKYSNIKMPLGYTDENVTEFLRKKLKLPQNERINFSLIGKSVDARRKDDIHFVLSVCLEVNNEAAVFKKNSRDKNLSPYKPFTYKFPSIKIGNKRPVIIGFGPAGMFAALYLAKCGMKPIVLERGLSVEQRSQKVNTFWKTGKLDTECNVQFGEGGAGTFSDGKLNTGVNNPLSAIVFNELVSHGAPTEILYDSKPHIGTDKLIETVRNIRRDIISMGGEVIFGAKFCDFTEKDGRISAVKYIKDGKENTVDADKVILAIGHSARDVFYMLKEKGIAMERKNFSVGMRIEHTQNELNRSMYGNAYSHPALPPADYKLAVHDDTGRGLYTFCMCPGGVITASSSEENTVVTNGMSYYARNGENANSALLVSVTPKDFDGTEVTAGIEFQRKIESAAFVAAGSDYKAPVSLAGDFLLSRLSSGFGSVKPTYPIGTHFALPESFLPQFVCKSLRIGLKAFGEKIPCFKNEEAVLTGPETRSSSPVKIVRDNTLCSVSLKGLYPCGEGAGYAGGIVTAAIDGIKCAMALIESIV